VGVIDSGIDVTHPCFADDGFDADVFADEFPGRNPTSPTTR